MLTNQYFFLGVGGCSQMSIMFQISCLGHSQAVESGIEDELMSGNHLVGTHRNNVAVMVDLMHDQAQPVQLSEVL